MPSLPQQRVRSRLLQRSNEPVFKTENVEIQVQNAYADLRTILSGAQAQRCRIACQLGNYDLALFDPRYRESLQLLH